MFGKALTYLGAIVLATIPLLLGFFLNLKKPDVRYSLSEAIPVSFLGTAKGANENIQQIEVQNFGTAAAEQIVLKTSITVTEHELLRNASTDAATVVDNQPIFEVIYEKLPPQARFKLILKSERALTGEDLSVTHSRGVARQVLAEDRRSAWAPFIGITLIGAYIVGLLWSLQLLTTSEWESSAHSLQPETLVKMSRPWFLTAKKWKNEHRKLLLDRMSHQYVGDPEDNVAKWVLSVKQPDHFDGAYWREVEKRAVDNLKDVYKGLAEAITEESARAMFRVEKPPGFPQADFDHLLRRAGDRFAELRTGWRNRSSFATLVSALEERRPGEIPEQIWLDANEKLQIALVESIARGAQGASDPSEWMGKQRIDVLDATYRRKVTEDIARLEESRLQETRAKEYSKLCTSLLRGSALESEKPSVLDPHDWQALEKLSRLIGDLKELDAKRADLREEREDFLKERSRFVTDKQSTEELRLKVTRQLEVINLILKEPGAIERLESHDATFAPGNLRNLRRVAEILSQTNGREDA